MMDLKNKEELITLHRPKHIKKNHLLDLERSKSAPIEETSDGEQNDDYLSSYNYYIYYNSITPRNPHMPKPTYKPNPNLAFIKESQKTKRMRIFKKVEKKIILIKQMN